jgi:hypothetical protein
VNIVSHNLNVQYVCYSTGWKIKYFIVIVYRLSSIISELEKVAVCM